MIVSTSGHISADRSADIRFDDNGMTAYDIRVCLRSGEADLRFLGVDRKWTGPYRMTSSNPAASYISVAGEIVYAIRIEAVSDSAYSLLAVVNEVSGGEVIELSQASLDEIAPRQLL